MKHDKSRHIRKEDRNRRCREQKKLEDTERRLKKQAKRQPEEEKTEK